MYTASSVVAKNTHQFMLVKNMVQIRPSSGMLYTVKTWGLFNQPGLLQLQGNMVCCEIPLETHRDLQKPHKYATLLSSLKELTNGGEAWVASNDQYVFISGLKTSPIVREWPQNAYR